MYKLLIVEDEHLIRKWLMYGLDYEKIGIVMVGEASNGEEGAEKIRKFKPDIVLTDINMPVKDAFAMFEATLDIPYKKVILSGYNDFPNAKRAIQYGVKDFIAKPLDEKELEESLIHLVGELTQEKNHYSIKVNEEQYAFFSEIRQSSDEVVKEILTWVQGNYQRHFVMADVAYELGYSESYLYKKIKDHLGITLNEYVTRYRLKMSITTLLENPELRVYEVADEVGFSDYKYFNKLFKKYMGMTVSEFKNQIQ